METQHWQGEEDQRAEVETLRNYSLRLNGYSFNNQNVHSQEVYKGIQIGKPLTAEQWWWNLNCVHCSPYISTPVLSSSPIRKWRSLIIYLFIYKLSWKKLISFSTEVVFSLSTEEAEQFSAQREVCELVNSGRYQLLDCREKNLDHKESLQPLEIDSLSWARLHCLHFFHQEMLRRPLRTPQLPKSSLFVTHRISL